MIPYQLKIQGVRDYSPRSIQFGEPDEHILITGPNGVGKSTLTFCLGAVLYSSKVEVEGLRSTNLKANEPWYARITLLFLNEGPTKVDGPKFIAFMLTVKQEAKNAPIQREFEVLNGPDEDSLTLQTRYTSGGTAGRTLTAYREDLQERYKIEPDLFYLIWYQQEVNQFAAMYPEERFRKFSDMFNISETQRAWEASLEKIKEVQVEIEYLKGIQKGVELSVNAAKTELNKYLDNKNRILISGQKYFNVLHQIIQKYDEQLEKTAQQKANDQIEKEKKLIEQQKVMSQLQQLEKEKIQISKEISQFEQEFSAIFKDLQLKQAEDEAQLAQQKRLENQLEAIDEKRKQLRFDAEATEYKLEEMTKLVEDLLVKQQELQENQMQLRQQERSLESNKASLSFKVDQLKETISQAEKYKLIYVSSAHIQQEITKIEQQNEYDFEQIQHVSMSVKTVEETMKQYEQKKVVSRRQQQGLAHLKQLQIEAYPLRELIELMPSAPVHLEKQLEAIKYTIFYVGKNYKPLNDLYYVSLPQLVPTESISKLPELGLQIRSNINNRMGNFADKALWWVKQFFVDSPKIIQNVLNDTRGVRGAQEIAQYILSDVAIEKLLQEQKEKYTKLSAELKQLQQQYTLNQSKHKELFSDLRTIQMAESTLLKQSEYTALKQQLQLVETELDTIYDEQNKVEIQSDNLKSELSDAKHEREFFAQQQSIHEELGAFAEQQMQLDRIVQIRKKL